MIRHRSSPVHPHKGTSNGCGENEYINNAKKTLLFDRKRQHSSYKSQRRYMLKLVLYNAAVLFVLACIGSILLYPKARAFVRASSSRGLRSVANDKPNDDLSSSSSTSIDDEGADFTEEAIERSKFLLPKHLNPGETSKILWKEDGQQVAEYGRIIGLPRQLTTEIQEFCKRTGLLEAFWSISYPDDDKSKDKARHGLEILDLKKKKTRGKWASMKASSQYSGSNMHWVDVIDEYAYEETIQVLKRGNFDVVLDAIGKEFNLDGLMVDGMGFLVLSHNESPNNGHLDEPGAGSDMYDLVFPILLPEDGNAEFLIGDDTDYHHIAPINYTTNVGFLIDGDTYHQTGLCDYRQKRELRVAVSIYLVNVNEATLDITSSDLTGIFPGTGKASRDWYIAEQGRGWDPSGNSLKNDKGRRPLTIKDEDEEQCPDLAKAGKCETDPYKVRHKCPKSCNIFIDDKLYYSEVIGSTSLS